MQHKQGFEDAQGPEERNVVQLKSAKRRRSFKSAILGIAVFTGIFGAGLAVTTLPLSAGFTNEDQSNSYRHPFDICGAVRHTCIVDGDTIWLEGVKIRIADIDTPEISKPRCDSEYARGIEARDRLRTLLDDRPFQMLSIGSRDEDRYGRKLRVIVQDGRSVGDLLVSEGLARTWSGRREPWC